MNWGGGGRDIEDGCIFSCLTSAIEYKSEQSKRFEDLERDGSRKLKLEREGCRCDRCWRVASYREVRDPPKFRKMVSSGEICIAKTRSEN